MRKFERRNRSLQLVGISALHHFKVWARLRRLVGVNGIAPFAFACLQKSFLTGLHLANRHRGPGCELADPCGNARFLENQVGKFVPALECCFKSAW